MPIWRSIAKSVTWRVIGVFLLGGLAYVFTDNLLASISITIAFNSIRIVLYVIHEEAWERWRPLARFGRPSGVGSSEARPRTSASPGELMSFPAATAGGVGGTSTGESRRD